jgi:hypothetical protein
MNITNKDKFASEFINRYATRGFGGDASLVYSWSVEE